jgi:hypothetical protein
MYGTPREFVIKKLEQGKDVLLEIDIQGALQVKATMPEGSLFLSPALLLKIWSTGFVTGPGFSGKYSCPFSRQRKRDVLYAVV